MRKLVAKFKKVVKDSSYLLLLVYETKNSYIGVLKENDNVLSTARFYERDGDKDLHRVCEYFNFKLSDIIK